MKKIGITGGIGAGKSLVCDIFNLLGIPSYNADFRAKWLQVHDADVSSKIKSLFGEKAYLDNGELNRKHISNLVFKDEKLLHQLNAIVHPAVGKDFTEWCRQHEDKHFILKEAALLYESGSYKSLDATINVHASRKLRLKRTLKRDPERGEENIQSIMDKQLEDHKRNELADYIIYNDESISLILQVNSLYHQLCAD